MGIHPTHSGALCRSARCFQTKQKQLFQIWVVSFRFSLNTIQEGSPGQFSTLFVFSLITSLPFSLVFVGHTVDGRNPAPHKKPWNDDPPVNNNKRYGFHHDAKGFSSIHSHMESLDHSARKPSGDPDPDRSGGAFGAPVHGRNEDQPKSGCPESRKYGYGSKYTHQGTAGFSLWLHLSGFHFGYAFFDPQPYDLILVCSFQVSIGGLPSGSPVTEPDHFSRISVLHIPYECPATSYSFVPFTIASDKSIRCVASALQLSFGRAFQDPKPVPPF